MSENQSTAQGAEDDLPLDMKQCLDCGPDTACSAHEFLLASWQAARIGHLNAELTRLRAEIAARDAECERLRVDVSRLVDQRLEKIVERNRYMGWYYAEVAKREQAESDLAAAGPGDKP